MRNSSLRNLLQSAMGLKSSNFLKCQQVNLKWENITGNLRIAVHRFSYICLFPYLFIYLFIYLLIYLFIYLLNHWHYHTSNTNIPETRGVINISLWAGTQPGFSPPFILQAVTGWAYLQACIDQSLKSLPTLFPNKLYSCTAWFFCFILVASWLLQGCLHSFQAGIWLVLWLLDWQRRLLGPLVLCSWWGLGTGFP